MNVKHARPPKIAKSKPIVFLSGLKEKAATINTADTANAIAADMFMPLKVPQFRNLNDVSDLTAYTRTVIFCKVSIRTALAVALSPAKSDERNPPRPLTPGTRC
jgi:hypothetical protein